MSYSRRKKNHAGLLIPAYSLGCTNCYCCNCHATVDVILSVDTSMIRLLQKLLCIHELKGSTFLFAVYSEVAVYAFYFVTVRGEMY